MPKILPGLPSMPAVRRLTPEEEKVRAHIEKVRNDVLAALAPAHELYKLVVLEEVVTEVIFREFTQGHRGEAFRKFVMDLQRKMANRNADRRHRQAQNDAAMIEGLLAPGKIGGGLKQ